MTRLAALFERTRAANRAALIGYFTAGDPGPVESIGLLKAASSAGIDALEVGVPFCDPILDGEIIRRAHERALARESSLASTLSMVARFRDEDGALPLILMGYYNPILSFGPRRFARAAALAGIDAVIVADLPLHEASSELLPELAAAGVALIPLYAPDLQRDDYAPSFAGIGGFLYCIPAAGPTGGSSVPLSVVERAVHACRLNTALPVSVGFGIKSPQAAAAVATVADGVIIGSALVAHVERWLVGPRPVPHALYERVGLSIAELRAAVETARVRGPNAT